MKSKQKQGEIRPSKSNAVHHELTPQQDQAVLMLAVGKKITEAAQKIAVDRSTLSRWNSHDPWFRHAVSEVRGELHRAAIDSMRGLVRDAVDVLKDELRGGDHAWQVALAILRPSLPSLAEAPAIEPTGEAIVHQHATRIAEDRCDYNPLESLLNSEPSPVPTTEDIQKATHDLLEEIDGR